MDNVQLTDRPDSGENGNDWALNHLHPQIKITESAPRVYDVTVGPNGMFSDRDRLGRRWLSHLGHPDLGAGASRNCTGLLSSPCLAPASDYDCASGEGDGPKYADGPIEVTGSDPYGLDGNNDGVGCES